MDFSDDKEWAAWVDLQRQCAGENVEDGWQHVKQTGSATFTAHRRGAILGFTPAAESEPSRGDRGKIKDMSNRSRLDAAYAFENASCDWHSMGLLTWREIPTANEVKRARDEFSRRWRGRWGEGMDAWILEMHRRGVPHLHLFIASESNFGVACRAAEKREVQREDASGKPNVTELVGGTPESWLAETWMSCIKCRDAETLAFNRGGILEVFRNPAGAARYVAKESSKRYQKELPERYADGLGRWWYLNPRWKPRVTLRGTVSVSALRNELGWERPLSRVWDAETLAIAIESARRPLCTIDMQTGAETVEA